MTPAEQLKQLRDDCASLITRIDGVLSLVHTMPPAGIQKFPLAVTGKCEAATQHAIDRFRERTGSKKSDETILKRMSEWIGRADEMVLKERFRINELLAHGKPARYFKYADMIFVVEDGAIVTAHHGSADRWIPKPSA